MNSSNNNSFKRLSGLTVRLGLSKSTIYKMIQAGTFPPPKQLGLRSVAWLESDISAWMDSRLSTKAGA